MERIKDSLLPQDTDPFKEYHAYERWREFERKSRLGPSLAASLRMKNKEAMMTSLLIHMVASDIFSHSVVDGILSDLETTLPYFPEPDSDDIKAWVATSLSNAINACFSVVDYKIKSDDLDFLSSRGDDFLIKKIQSRIPFYIKYSSEEEVSAKMPEEKINIFLGYIKENPTLLIQERVDGLAFSDPYFLLFLKHLYKNLFLLHRRYSKFGLIELGEGIKFDFRGKSLEFMIAHTRMINRYFELKKMSMREIHDRSAFYNVLSYFLIGDKASSERHCLTSTNLNRLSFNLEASSYDALLTCIENINGEYHYDERLLSGIVFYSSLGVRIDHVFLDAVFGNYFDLLRTKDSHGNILTHLQKIRYLEHVSNLMHLLFICEPARSPSALVIVLIAFSLMRHDPPLITWREFLCNAPESVSIPIEKLASSSSAKEGRTAKEESKVKIAMHTWSDSGGLYPSSVVTRSIKASTVALERGLQKMFNPFLSFAYQYDAEVKSDASGIIGLIERSNILLKAFFTLKGIDLSCEDFALFYRRLKSYVYNFFPLFKGGRILPPKIFLQSNIIKDIKKTLCIRADDSVSSSRSLMSKDRICIEVLEKIKTLPLLFEGCSEAFLEEFVSSSIESGDEGVEEHVAVSFSEEASAEASVKETGPH